MTDSNQNQFGIEFDKLLKKAGINQSTLAAKSEISSSTFSKWKELHSTTSPSREYLDKVSTALSLDLDILRGMAKEQCNSLAYMRYQVIL